MVEKRCFEGTLGHEDEMRSQDAYVFVSESPLPIAYWQEWVSGLYGKRVRITVEDVSEAAPDAKPPVPLYSIERSHLETLKGVAKQIRDSTARDASFCARFTDMRDAAQKVLMVVRYAESLEAIVEAVEDVSEALPRAETIAFIVWDGYEVTADLTCTCGAKTSEEIAFCDLIECSGCHVFWRTEHKAPCVPATDQEVENYRVRNGDR